MFFFDPLYLAFMIPGLILALGAQAKLRGAFAKYSAVPNSRGLTGAQAAHEVLRNAGVYDVQIEPIPGELTDHFDPRSRVLRLSEPIYSGRSIASLAVAAHEAGHAVQQQVGYAPMALRQNLVPVANIGSNIGMWAIVLGVMLHFTTLAWFGLVLFAGLTLFQLVTLPVEYNASARARELLERSGLVTPSEAGEVRSMLNAAALTYVAGFASSLLTLLYYGMLVSGTSRREE